MLKVKETRLGHHTLFFFHPSNNSTISPSSRSLVRHPQRARPTKSSFCWTHNVASTSGSHLNQGGFQGHRHPPPQLHLTQHLSYFLCIGAESSDLAHFSALSFTHSLSFTQQFFQAYSKTDFKGQALRGTHRHTHSYTWIWLVRYSYRQTGLTNVWCMTHHGQRLLLRCCWLHA